MSEATQADWCIEGDGVVICGTRMVEYSRTSEGVKWCFVCRERAEFAWVVKWPDGPSYYDGYAFMECGNCGASDGDLFPGWYRGDGP